MRVWGSDGKGPQLFCQNEERLSNSVTAVVGNSERAYLLAVVVPAADRAGDPGLADEILGALRGRISDFKIPRGLDFVDELPRTPTGKLVKRRIVQQYTSA